MALGADLASSNETLSIEFLRLLRPYATAELGVVNKGAATITIAPGVVEISGASGQNVDQLDDAALSWSEHKVRMPRLTVRAT